MDNMVNMNNMTNNEMMGGEMKPKNKGFKWLIVIILVVLLAVVGFLIINKTVLNKDKENTETKETDNKKDEKENSELATPLLYEVTKDGSDTKIYLFGSIHVADERAYPMQPKIMNAYNSSEYIAVEFDMIEYQKNLALQTESLKPLMYLDGSTIKDYLKEDTYKRMVKYLKENGQYNHVFEMYKPAMFYSLVTSVATEKSKLNSKKGIDMYFLEKAKEDKKGVLEVESALSQYEMLGGVSDELMDFMIVYGIENEQSMINEVVSLYENWLKGNAQGLLDDDADSIDEETIKKYSADYPNLKSLMDDYNNELVYKRNDKMTKKVDGYFKEGKNTFVVVGAAHIVGETGIANQLEKSGYKVNLVSYE